MFHVFNPGSHPAPRWAAKELAHRRELAGYWTALQFIGTGLGASFVSRTPLGNRVLPPGLPRSLVHRNGQVPELQAIIAARSREAERARGLLVQRNRRVAAVLLRGLKESDAASVLLPTETGSGIEEHLLARSVPYILYTPLPHPASGLRVYERELAVNPGWARFFGEYGDDVGDGGEAYEGARFLLANSMYTAQTFAEQGLDTRTVPLGVDLARLRRYGLLGAASAVRRRAGEPLKVAYSGQILQRKGLSYLFQSLAGLAPAHIELDLYGVDRFSMAEALTAAFPNVRATFHGVYEQGRLWEALSRSHVFVFPSLHEGFGNSIAEAAALGLPVVTTPACGARDLDLVPGAALEVPVGDPEGLALALESLIRDEELRHSMSCTATRIMTNSPGWAGYAVRVADELTSLA